MNAEQNKKINGHEKLSDQELVAGYHREEVTGQEIMDRFLKKADRADMVEKPLKRRDGSIIVGADNTPLQIRDYFEQAGQHPGAVNVILGFVAMDKSLEDFPAKQAAAAAMIDLYALPGTSSSADT